MAMSSGKIVVCIGAFLLVWKSGYSVQLVEHLVSYTETGLKKVTFCNPFHTTCDIEEYWCNFEDGEICEHMKLHNSDWTIVNTLRTGVDLGPDTASEGKRYAFVESATDSMSATLFIEPNLFEGSQCLEFHYSMSDLNTGTFNVSYQRHQGSAEHALWSLPGTQHREWQQASMNVTNYVHGSRIILRGAFGPGSGAYVAVDNIIYSKGLCEKAFQPENANTQLFIDCQDVFENGIRDSGLFPIKTRHFKRYMTVWCDFDDEHGWTVIQRRLDGSVDFYRNWESYAAGFGDKNREYWIGLENIYHLTLENRKLNIFMEDHEGEKRAANYSGFYIEGADAGYRLAAALQFDGGAAGDSMVERHAGQAFSTFDHGPSDGCASTYKGAWWYDDCHISNLNGLWYQDGHYTEYATGVVWHSWKDYHYSLKTVVMRITRN